MLMMAMTMSMEIRMLDGPIRENVLQSLDMTTPKPGCGRSPDHLLLQDTMKSDPPEAPIRAIGNLSSCIMFIHVLDNEVSRPVDTPFGPQE